MHWSDWYVRKRLDGAYAVLAMQRSGHHAVVNRLCYQMGRVLHLNACVLARRGIYPAAGRYRTYDDGDVFDSGRLAHSEYKRRIRAVARLHSQVVYSFENARLGRDYLRWAPRHKRGVTICVVRDPFNWIASSLEHGGEMARRLPERIAGWKAQVEQCLNENAYPYGLFVGISYNRWVTEESYVREVCGRLALPYSVEGRDEVVDFGPGSSFDRTRYHGAASRMKVLERWCSYRDDSRYLAFFENDTDLVRLSELYFQFNPLRDPDRCSTVTAAIRGVALG